MSLDLGKGLRTISDVQSARISQQVTEIAQMRLEQANTERDQAQGI